MKPVRNRISEIDWKRFIDTWNSCGSVSEVCEKLGRCRQGIYARARLFRKHGVRLKDLSNRYNWEKVRAYSNMIKGKA